MGPVASVIKSLLARLQGVGTSIETETTRLHLDILPVDSENVLVVRYWK
jgi:hypothetical protein